MNVDKQKQLKQILSDLAKNKVSNEGAQNRIAKLLTRQELGEYLVDAFQRDWITNFNVGLSEDGDVI